jgi:hypothetical protein
MRWLAQKIASRLPTPDFYVDFPLVHAFSQRFFALDPIVRAVRRIAFRALEEDFGHGIVHARKVSLDAGALVIIECRQNGCPLERIRRRLRLAHCAGLLHDVRRKEADHAAAGAEYARGALSRSALFPPSDIEAICGAIRNHEAFRKVLPIQDRKGRLISNCLYDADKFRWGCDNFTDTVWTMVAYLQVPIPDFLERYPAGLAKIAKIKETFRSETGRCYGPRFVDTGLALGRQLYEILERDFRKIVAP